jgi:hypothetical protein
MDYFYKYKNNPCILAIKDREFQCVAESFPIILNVLAYWKVSLSTATVKITT